jgi:D-alanine--poly(phosphoribitol) ligase subunit 1
MNDTGHDEVMYRTGDLVYRDTFGDYVYVDRADRVVKRSGVRISLLELNALMGTVAGVVAVASLTYDREGELGIVAFVTTERELSNVDLRRALRKLLPDNMLPDRIEHVVTMPLNRSNQLDEAQLLLGAGLRQYRPPTN